MMNKKLKPSIVLGTGNYGLKIAEKIYEGSIQKQLEVDKLICNLGLTDDGRLYNLNSGNTYCEISGLKNEMRDGIWESNYENIISKRKELTDALSDSIEMIRQKKIISILEQEGYEIDKSIAIFLFATIFDPVGSSSIIPFLESLEDLFSGEHRGSIFEINLFLFFPDLFKDSEKDELAFARSYAFIQELDSILEGSNQNANLKVIPPDFIWLLSSRNEDNQFVASYEELIPMLSEFVFMHFTNTFVTDTSFSSVLLDREEGKTRRYSSIGLSKLIYPSEQIIKILYSYYAYSILEQLSLGEDTKFERNTVFLDAKDFLITKSITQISRDIKRTADAIEIWKEFKFKGSMSENVIVENFLDDLRTQSNEYETTNFLKIKGEITQRKTDLLNEKYNVLLNHIMEYTDTKEKGPYYAHAFLNGLIDKDSPYLKGERSEAIYVLQNIRDEVSKFFDSYLGITDERTRLALVEQDLKDKKNLLKNYEQSLSERKNSNKDDEKEDAEGEIPNEDSGKNENPKKISSVEQKIKKLENEIEELSKEKDELINRIEDADLAIEDASKRRKLLQIGKDNTNKEIGEASTELSQTESKYRNQKSKVEDLEEQKQKSLKKYLIIYPTILTIGFIVISIIFPLYTPISNFQILKWGTIIYLTCLLIYSISSIINYQEKIGKPLKQSIKVLESLKTEKIGLLFKLQNFHNKIFKNEFDFYVQGEILSWVTEIERRIVNLSEEVNKFIRELKSLYENKKKQWEERKLDQSIFIKTVIDINYVDDLISDIPSIQTESQRFLSNNKLSTFFEKYLDQENLNNLEKELTNSFKDINEIIAEKTLEDILNELKINNAEKLETKISSFYNDAKTFISLDIEKGIDNSVNLIFVGVNDPQGSLIREVLKKQGHTDCEYKFISNNREASAYKLKIGFPAFQIGLIKYCRQTLSKIQAKDIYSNPEWNSEELIPALIKEKEDINEAIKVACIGLALEIIQTEDYCYYFESNKIGDDKTDLISFLKENRNSALLNRIQDEIDQVLQDYDLASVKLEEYKRKLDPEAVEIKIIDKTLEILNPLA